MPANVVFGISERHDFRVVGGLKVDEITPPFLVDRLSTGDRILVACGTAPSGGPLTVQFETSSDGVVYSSVGTSISVPDGAYSAAQAFAATIPAGTLMRAKAVAINRAADITVTLYLKVG